MDQDNSVCTTLSTQGLLSLVTKNAAIIKSSELEKRIKTLLQDYVNFKKDILEIIQNTYVEFKPNLKTSQDFTDVCQRLFQDFENALQEIKIHLKKGNPLKSHLLQLKKNLKTEYAYLNILRNYLLMDININEAKIYQNDSNLNKMMSNIKKVEELLAKNCTYDQEIVKGILNQNNELFSEFVLNFSELLDVCVWENTTNSIFLTINHINQETFKQYLDIFDSHKELSFYFNDFSYLFLESLFKPIIKRNYSIIIYKNTIKINFLDTQKDKNKITDTIQHLTGIFRFMNRYLKLNSFNLLGKIGKVIAIEFLNFFNDSIKHLKYTFKKNEIENLNIFKEFLLEIGFIPVSSKDLFEFDIINIEKEDLFHHDLLMQAKEILLDDNKGLIEVEGFITDNMLKDEILKHNLNTNYLQNKFKISYCLNNLLILLDNHLRDKTVTNEKMFFTFREVFQLYILEGEKYIIPNETSAFNIGVFHNNTEYLTFRYLQFGVHFRRRSKQTIFSFADLILRIKYKADDAIQNLMENEQKEILSILERNLESSRNVEIQQLNECFKRLRLLKSNWNNLLPDLICNKSIGWLLNLMITKVLNEFKEIDINSGEIKKIWNSLFDKLVEISYALFQNETNLTPYVLSWDKLFTLLKIFNMNIRDLEIQLINKELPVSNLFTQEEWKNLINILFLESETKNNIIHLI